MNNYVKKIHKLCEEVFNENVKIDKNYLGYSLVSKSFLNTGEIVISPERITSKELYYYLLGYYEREYLDRYHKQIEKKIRETKNPTKKQLCEDYFANYYTGISLKYEDNRVKVFAGNSCKMIYKSYTALWNAVLEYNSINSLKYYKDKFIHFVD